jgi:hypothetical protein
MEHKLKRGRRQFRFEKDLLRLMVEEKNSKRSVLTELNRCKNRQEEIDLIKSMIEGPKFFAFFQTLEDAKKIAAKIPYIERHGTVTYIRQTVEGYQLFTGGKISQEEAAKVAAIIMDPNSLQIGTTFFDSSDVKVVN